MLVIISMYGISGFSVLSMVGNVIFVGVSLNLFWWFIVNVIRINILVVRINI